MPLLQILLVLVVVGVLLWLVNSYIPMQGTQPRAVICEPKLKVGNKKRAR